MANIKNHDKPQQTRRRYQVTAIRKPLDPEHFARFHAELNRQLALIADEIGKFPRLDRDFTPDDYVRKDELEDQIGTITANNLDLLSSQGEATAPPATTPTDPTTGTGAGPDDGAAAVEDALPTAAPPPVQTNSDIGTTTSPPHFSLQDHTHGGIRALRKNSGGAEFTRRRVNLIEGTGVTITMVDDGVDDEVDVTLDASSSTDTGFHRIFLLMGA